MQLFLYPKHCARTCTKISKILFYCLNQNSLPFFSDHKVHKVLQILNKLKVHQGYISGVGNLLNYRSRTSWRDQPDARQLTLGILTPGTSWRSRHPDAKSSKLLRFAFFLFLLFAFPRYATATLLTINVRLLWRKYNIFRNYKLHTNLCFAETSQKRAHGKPTKPNWQKIATAETNPTAR